MKKLVLNNKFIFFLIVINSIIIFIDGFNLKSSQFLEIIDNIITLIFIIEVIVKIKTYGRKNYFNSTWNIFDFILISISIPSLVSFFLPINFIQLDVLLIFRILRVFKFVRFIRFLPNVDKIINGAYNAAKSSILIFISFFIFNFIISILSCFIFKNIAPEYFENPLISFYSIFKIFTVEGWYEIPDNISENLDSNVHVFLTKIYFILILFIGGIFGLSLVNSIFVDNMISDNNNDLEEKIDRLEEKIDDLKKLLKSD